MRFYRLEKDNLIRKWIGIIIKGILISLIATVIIMFACGYKFMIVSSGSMEPTLPVGSLVIVTPCEIDELEYGDIVTMNKGGIYLTHRIVGKYNPDNPDVELKPGEAGYDEAKYWVTRGDATQELDSPLNDEIVGVVQDHHAFTWVGLAVRYVRANAKFIVVLVILLIALISVMEWFKSKLIPDDIEVYENEDEE